MAVRTHGAKVFDRIKLIFLPDLAHRCSMVDVDDACRLWAVHGSRTEPANHATVAVFAEADHPCSAVSLVTVDGHLYPGSFPHNDGFVEFVFVAVKLTFGSVFCCVAGARNWMTE